MLLKYFRLYRMQDARKIYLKKVDYSKRGDYIEKT
jgi:hypothetical protein